MGVTTDRDGRLSRVYDKPGVEVRRNAALNLADGVLTSVQWDVEEFDDFDMWAPASNTRLVVPVTGKWLVHYCISYATGGAATRRYVNVLKNGADSLLGDSLDADNTGNCIIASSGVPAILAAGDFIECQAYQLSGGVLGLSTVLNAFLPQPRFGMRLQA